MEVYMLCENSTVTFILLATQHKLGHGINSDNNSRNIRLSSGTLDLVVDLNSMGRRMLQPMIK